jgi:hypothetical protein
VAFIGTLDRSRFNVECLPDGGIGGICTGAATTGGTANYILEISSVPVPAAVWLFGSAMIGVLGLRRKSAAVAAA